MRAFELAQEWPAPNTSICIIDRQEQTHTFGDTSQTSRIASVSKLLTAWAAHIAIEEGSTTLDAAVGQEGCTLAHLLAHSGGYSFDGDAPIVSPARKRIYSNSGYDLIAGHLTDVTQIAFSEYLNDAVFSPLGMTSSLLNGSGAKDVVSCVDDLVEFALELRNPRLVSSATARAATTTQFADLEGVVPGVGRFSPCNWGYGPEIHGAKHPHWMGTRNSASTFGHFGGTGSFIWHDPVANISCITLCRTEFDNWALHYWPQFVDALLDELGN
jgi:CubicO group peptidase (beta-lactamase class C family)